VYCVCDTSWPAVESGQNAWWAVWCRPAAQTDRCPSRQRWPGRPPGPSPPRRPGSSCRRRCISRHRACFCKSAIVYRITLLSWVVLININGQKSIFLRQKCPRQNFRSNALLSKRYQAYKPEKSILLIWACILAQRYPFNKISSLYFATGTW